MVNVLHVRKLYIISDIRYMISGMKADYLSGQTFYKVVYKYILVGQAKPQNIVKLFYSLELHIIFYSFLNKIVISV